MYIRERNNQKLQITVKDDTVLSSAASSVQLTTINISGKEQQQQRQKPNAQPKFRLYRREHNIQLFDKIFIILKFSLNIVTSK